MTILPLKSIREEDVSIVGQNLLNLAKLKQSEFPVPEGVVITPPQIQLKTILEHHEFANGEIFDQKLEIIKKHILKINPPKDLLESPFGQKTNIQVVWINLLGVWLEEIRSHIWRVGFSQVTNNLSAQVVFITEKITASGKAYYDEQLERPVITVEQGQLSEKDLENLTELIKKADSELFITHVYSWVFDNKIKIVKVVPFTPKDDKVLEFKPSLPVDPVIRPLQTVTRVFIDLQEGFVVGEDYDGVIVGRKEDLSADQKILQLVESASNVSSEKTIFMLPDIKDTFGGLRGALRLINQQDILKENVSIFLYARNNRGLNVQIGVPFVRSTDEFLHLKKDLATLGVSRRGNLEIWLEMAVPENLLNIEEYITAGFDGAFINLDQITAWLIGYDPDHSESHFYKKQVNSLLNLLDLSLDKLHKAKIPVLVSGEIVFHDDVLKFLVRKNTWGICTTPYNSKNLREHISFLEKNNIRKR